MAGNAKMDTATRHRAAITEPELVSRHNTTPQRPSEGRQITKESSKIALAALPSNEAHNQNPSIVAQTDNFVAVQAEVNVEESNSAGVMEITHQVGEPAELSARYSANWGRRNSEDREYSHQSYHDPQILGSTRESVTRNGLERPLSLTNCGSSTRIASTGMSRFRGRNPFSRRDEARSASQSTYDERFPASPDSDCVGRPPSTREFSSRHRFHSGPSESSTIYDQSEQDEMRLLKADHVLGRRSQSGATNTEDDDQSTSTSLFVEDSNRDRSPHPYRVLKRGYRNIQTRERSPDFSHDSYANLPSNKNRHPARRPSLSPPVTISGGLRCHEDSKYSGVSVPWRTSIVPKMSPGDEISDASLQKRGLKRGQGDKVCKRGYGANDPENIAIVNMKEKDKMSFQAIADYLNKQRVAQGRQPTLSVCGIAGRYNRTAPLLFASQGKIFVPLSERRTSEGEARHGTLAAPGNDSAYHQSTSIDDGGDTAEGSQTMDERPVMNNSTWNSELDILLVQLHKEYEADRWQTIAKEFTDRTGMIVNPGQVALRHAIL